MPYWMYASESAALRKAWVPLTLWGVGFVAAGVVVIGWPTLVAKTLLIMVGVFAVLSGLVWVSWALTLRRESEGVWAITTVPGVLLIVLGIFAIIFRAQMVTFFLWVAAAVAIVWGLVDMISSWRLHSFFDGWWLRLLRGVIVAGLGVLFLLVPSKEALKPIAWVVGLFPILMGVVTIWMAFWVRRLPKSGTAVVTSPGVEEEPPALEAGPHGPGPDA